MWDLQKEGGREGRGKGERKRGQEGRRMDGWPYKSAKRPTVHSSSPKNPVGTGHLLLWKIMPKTMQDIVRNSGNCSILILDEG